MVGVCGWGGGPTHYVVTPTRVEVELGCDNCAIFLPILQPQVNNVPYICHICRENRYHRYLCCISAYISTSYICRVSAQVTILPPQGSSLYLCNTPGPQVVAQFAIRYKKVLQSASDLTRWLQQSHSINIQKIF